MISPGDSTLNYSPLLSQLLYSHTGSRALDTELSGSFLRPVVCGNMKHTVSKARPVFSVALAATRSLADFCNNALRRDKCEGATSVGVCRVRGRGNHHSGRQVVGEVQAGRGDCASGVVNGEGQRAFAPEGNGTWCEALGESRSVRGDGQVVAGDAAIGGRGRQDAAWVPGVLLSTASW